MMVHSRFAGLVITVILLAFLPGLAVGGSGLSISSDTHSAIVVIDGAMAGKTPLRVENLSPGLHQIRVLHPDVESWFSPVIHDSVSLADGEVRELSYRFTRNTFVMTDPSGAEIVLGGTVVATTPAVVETIGDDSLMQVRMHGYETAFVDPRQGVVSIRLDRAINGDLEANVIPEESRSSLPLFLSGASSLIAGGFSVYFKVQADEVYAEYLRTGDPVKLAETRKLDNVSGIALGAAEIYFVLFSYLLLSY